MLVGQPIHVPSSWWHLNKDTSDIPYCPPYKSFSPFRKVVPTLFVVLTHTSIMEPQTDIPSVIPTVEDSDTHITRLMEDRQPPHDVSQGSSDGEHMHLSNTSTQPATPPVPQLETTLMPDESVVPYRTSSDSLPELPQNPPASDACQPVIASDVHRGAQQLCASHSQDSAKYSVSPMDLGSDDNTHSTKSTRECGPCMDSAAPCVPAPLVPLPESDVEEDHSSESSRDEDDGSTAGSSSSQNSDAYSTSTDDPDPPSAVRPSKHSPLDPLLYSPIIF